MGGGSEEQHTSNFPRAQEANDAGLVQKKQKSSQWLTEPPGDALAFKLTPLQSCLLLPRCFFVMGRGHSLPKRQNSAHSSHPQWHLLRLEIRLPRSVLSSSAFILKNVFPPASKDMPHKVSLNQQDREVQGYTVVGAHLHSNQKFYLNLLEKYKPVYAFEK